MSTLIISDGLVWASAYWLVLLTVVSLAVGVTVGRALGR